MRHIIPDSKQVSAQCAALAGDEPGNKSLFYTGTNEHPTPMNKALFERPQEPRRWNGAAYTCTDGVKVSYEYKVFEIEERTTRKIGLRGTITAPRNGILLQSGKPPIVVVNRTLTSRDMNKIIHGGPGKTYAFPKTVIIVGEKAFYKNTASSVRFS